MSIGLRRGDKNIFDASAWISQSEAARLRGVSREAIYNLVKKNRFTTFKIGDKTLINREDVENYQPQPSGRKPKKRRNEVESTPPQTRRTSNALRDRNGTSKRQTSNSKSISGYPDKSTVNQLIWISQAEAARLRDISPQSISELVKRGRFTTMMVGARKFLKRSEVESFEPQLPGPDPKRKRKM
jgi:excisionase family DNA binding protein